LHCMHGDGSRCVGLDRIPVSISTRSNMQELLIARSGAGTANISCRNHCRPHVFAQIKKPAR
jgi:hypothetical protein